MPVSGLDKKSVLGYRCESSHNLVGFGHFSKPAVLVGIHLPESSLAEAKNRFAINKIGAELIKLDSGASKLPWHDTSLDYIHSSGVPHHTPDPVRILREFSGILKPGGVTRVIVYNYDSLWLHLYVAHQRSILQNLYPGENNRDQFRRSTDGENRPISNCYRPAEWNVIYEQAGFGAEFIGAAVSMYEMSLLSLRYVAIKDRYLRAENSNILMELHCDVMGYPLWNGQYAGFDGCFLLTKSDE